VPNKCRQYPLKSNQEQKEKMNAIQMKSRYNELLRLAKNGDYFSMAELDELIRLSKDLGII
jgi:hypothetical protein